MVVEISRSFYQRSIKTGLFKRVTKYDKNFQSHAATYSKQMLTYLSYIQINLFLVILVAFEPELGTAEGST